VARYERGGHASLAEDRNRNGSRRVAQRIRIAPSSLVVEPHQGRAGARSTPPRRVIIIERDAAADLSPMIDVSEPPILGILDVSAALSRSHIW
jgi:hypothetical protein